MRICFVLNGFLGSKGTIEFVINCYHSITDNLENIGLSKKPLLIYIKEPPHINFIKRLLGRKNTIYNNSENKALFANYEIKKLNLFEYYVFKVRNNIKCLGVIDIPRLIFTDVGYIYDCQHILLKDNFSLLERMTRNFSFISNLIFAKRVIVNSKSVKKELLTFYPIIPGIKIVNLPFMPINQTLSKKLNNLSNSKFEYLYQSNFILISNRWWNHKNHISAIRAFKKIKSKLDKEFGFNKCRLIITGSIYGNRNKTLQFNRAIKYIKKNKLDNSIFILGHVSDELLELLFSKSMGIIQPTLFEGGPGGFTAWKAIGMKKTLALSDIDINKELIEFVDNLIFFNPNSLNEISDIIFNIFTGKVKNTKILNTNHKELKYKYAKKIIDNF